MAAGKPSNTDNNKKKQNNKTAIIYKISCIEKLKFTVKQ